MSRYDDIIGLPHHVSRTRPQMSLRMRAAQFAPFAALSGHNEVIDEAARLTIARIELTEDEAKIISDNLADAILHISERPKVKISYFVPDMLKAGGSYMTKESRLFKFDEFGRIIILSDKTVVHIDSILKFERLF